MAETHEILKALNWRYATKQFDTSKKLSDGQVSFLKETLRLSASSFGFQPWKFLFITDSELRKRLRTKAFNQTQVEEASHLIVLCRQEKLTSADVDKLISATSSATGAPEDSLAGFKNVLSGFVSGLSQEKAEVWCEKQVYIALGSLLTAAARAGIDACPMEGFERPGFDEVLGLEKKGLRSVVLCTVGIRSEGDKYATRAKVRYPLADVVETI
ncbi:MAG: NAD(P)H-dependent oxidoreductase [Elusimicrobia bacterium]|nr:MAG: NAD(P)H-dependent oxidoreductase [Elusimicrobiota bacterium]